MMTFQLPPIPKPEDVMNALQKAGAQSINGLFLTLSAPIEFVKGLGVPVPELPGMPTSGTQPAPTPKPVPLFGIPLPFIGGQSDVTYEPYSAGQASEGGSKDVTIEVNKQKEIWV